MKIDAGLHSYMKRGRTGIWRSNFTDPSGNRIRCSLKTRDPKMAQVRVGKMMVNAYEKGYFDLKRPTRVPFSKLADKVLVYAKDKTERYDKVYSPTIKTLRVYLDGRTLSEITKSVVLDVQSKIKERVSAANSNNAMVILKRMFNLAIEWGLTEANPVRGLKLYKVLKHKVRFLSVAEKERLLACCPEYMKEIVLVALHTGMRKGEILGLTWDNVDLRNRLIVLVKTKSNKIREIPMSNEVYELLQAKYQKSTQDREACVFPSPDGKPYRDVAAFRKAVQLAGIQNFWFHDLRHSFASYLVMAGVDLVTVKELLGHAELSTTLIYAHLAPKHKQAAIVQLEAYFGKEKEASTSDAPVLFTLPKQIGTKLAHSGNLKAVQK